MSGAEEIEAFQTVAWIGDAARGSLRLIDQTRLPTEFLEIDCHDAPTVWEAIKLLRVRGAPAIGVAAGYGAVFGGSGSGKSTLFRNMLAIDIAAGHGVTVVDPHGQLVDDLLDHHIPRGRTN
ncbi:MAG: hypothetical protein WB773_13035, partial [Isosphaeraceae bacterium]